MDSLEKEAKADMRNKKVVDSEKLVSHDASKKVTQDSTVSNISGTNDTTKPLNIHDGQTGRLTRNFAVFLSQFPVFLTKYE